MNKIKKRLKASVWAVKIAWRLSKTKLLGWSLLSIILSVLPSLSLIYYRRIVSDISIFLNNGTGNIGNAITNVVILGLILSFIGLSNRINGDLLYMVMYDSYYLGMEELLMDTIQQIDIEFFRNKEIRDEYNSIIRRAGSLTDFISSFCMFISRMFGTITLLVVAFTNSVLIFVISLIYITFVLIMNYLAAENNRGKIVKIRRAERTAQRYEDLSGNLSVAKELRIFSSKSQIINTWEDAYKVVKAQRKEQDYQRARDAYLLEIGFYVFNVLALIYSIFMVCSRKMTPSVFLVIYALCQNMSTYIADITQSILGADIGLYALERQLDFITSIKKMNTIPEKAIQETELVEDVIKTEHVSYGYSKDSLTLKDINLQIKKGETVALVGYNGSGKTTLIKLLIKLFQPFQGDIYLMDHNFNDIGYEYINSKIGVFFQNYSLFHATIKENVGFGDIRYIDQEKLIYEAIKKGGAEDIIKMLPEGIESWLFRVVKKDGYELSGGQKQRIAVARTYMNNKDVLIFDEPAAALDPIAEMRQFRKIKEKIQGKTAILISHRIGFARMADRIIVLDEGKIAEEGTHEELMGQKGLYYSFYKQQAEWYNTDCSTAEVLS